LALFPKLRAALAAFNRSPLWFRLSSLALLILGTCLLALSLGSEVYSSRFVGVLIPMLLAGIYLGVLVFALYFRIAWRKQLAHDSRSRTADHTLASVFQHVLDGILIVDDEGICLDTNPAACHILGVSRQALLGKPIAHFYVDSEEFERNWRSFRESGNQRGRTQLRRGDEQIVFVDYAVAANYMPGRHLVVLCDTTEKTSAEVSLRESQERLQEIAENIQEVFWVMDAKTKQILFVNPAYETVTGYSPAALYADRFSCAQIVHADDRDRVLRKLDEASATGLFDQEFRIVRADGTVRWISCKTSPRPPGQPHWFVGTALDVTPRKNAELEANRNLVAAVAAHAETEALRKSTFALTQNLSMDAVLDTLLACLHDLVPYDAATVILAEDELRLFVAREAPKGADERSFITLQTTDCPLFQRVLIERKNVSIPETAEESDWRDIKPLAGNRSWMGIPLMTAKGMFGLLSIGASTAHRFTTEHLRLAKSMAAPAAAAIYNVRLYERAEIYASELQYYVDKLKETQKQLEHPRGRETAQS
jgi:PAS domain S-box-containing protein